MNNASPLFILIAFYMRYDSCGEGGDSVHGNLSAEDMKAEPHHTVEAISIESFLYRGCWNHLASTRLTRPDIDLGVWTDGQNYHLAGNAGRDGSSPFRGRKGRLS